MPRRLLVISHGFPPYYGGAEHAAGYLARAAVSCGRWTVEVLTSDIGGRLPARESWQGMTVYRVSTRKKQWDRHTVPELISFLRTAQRSRVFSLPDILLAHFTLPAGEVARQISQRTGIPYAVVLQGSDVPGYQNRRFGPLYPVVKPLVRRIWRSAAQVFAVSESLRDLALQTWPEGSIEVIPNGVDLDFFQPSQRLAAPNAKDRKNLLVIAQLIERKGIQYLLEAIALLPPTLRGQISLTVCGVGPYEQELRWKAESCGLLEQVEFAGLVKHEQLPTRHRAADLFVLPTLQEGLPLALLEAMASGVPVLATSAGGIPQLVRDGENGVLVHPADVPALARALEHMLTNDALLARLRVAARASVEPWSWSRLWDRYEAALPPGRL